MTTKSNFSLDASLVDLNGLSPGNFSRPSLTQIERTIDDAIQVYPIESFAPAIDSETSAALLEPMGLNYVTWNLKLSKSEYIKGSNIVVQEDEVKDASGSNEAERLGWLPYTNNENAQILQRSLILEAGVVHTLSILLKLESGGFTPTDVVRVVGDVVGTPQISMSALNAYPKRYRLLQLSFTTAGREPNLPDVVHDVPDYAVTAVTATTITITVTKLVVANDLVGGTVLFTNVANTYFLITANSATSGSSVTITLNTTNLPALGVTTSSRVSLSGAPKQIVQVELFSRSSAVVNWGGMQVEPLPFRTSMIFQEGEITVRSAAQLSYRNSPIANLRTFGVFMELKYWRGDGNVFNFGNFKARIDQNRLYVQAGATIISTADVLPTGAIEIFAQVAEETTSLSLFVNGILKARTTLVNFVADPTDSLVLTSAGVRCIQRFLTTDSQLLDGNPVVGDFAGDEVASLFDNPVVIDATAISSHAPLVHLNSVTVPGQEPPTASSKITAITSASRIVTVASGAGFTLNSSVAVYRGEFLITRARIVTISGNDLTLDTIAAMVIDDTVVQGNVDQPGRTSARFPWDPLEQMVVTAINAGLKRVTVDAALSFSKDRAFIISPLYQDKAEVLIENIDTGNGYLFVSDVSQIAMGDTIAQPLNELFVDPQNYFAGILNPVDGVQIVQKYTNGVVIENKNPFPVIVRPYIRVYL